MTFDEIFEAYYTLYRMEAETPNTEDDEYKIAMRLANEAVNRWEGYDHTYWYELFQTLQVSGDGDATIEAGTTDYDAPEDFKEAGGFVRVKNAQGQTIQRYKIVEPETVQFQNEAGIFCYFTGNPAEGYVLHLNPAPSTSMDGMDFDYVYYRAASKFTAGSDITEMSDPYFCVHRMLANRFRGSRNPFASDAKGDAENVLKTMQLKNISGNWADPWKLADNSGSSWGQ